MTEALIPTLPAPMDNPAAVYLASLAGSSRATMVYSLRAICRSAGYVPTALDPVVTFPWGQLRYAHIQAIRSALIDSALAPATLNRHLAALRGVLRAAWRLGLLSAEELARATDFRGVRGSRLAPGRMLSSGEIAALFEVARAGAPPAGPRDGAILALAYASGLRRGSIAAMVLGAYRPTERELRAIVKGNKEIRLPVPPRAATILDRWLEVRGPADGYLVCHVNRHGSVEPARPLGGQGVYWILERLGKAAGVAFTPHDLRRTFASELLARGVDLETVRLLMGHANIATTAGYDRRGEERLTAAVELLHLPATTPGETGEEP